MKRRDKRSVVLEVECHIQQEKSAEVNCGWGKFGVDLIYKYIAGRKEKREGVWTTRISYIYMLLDVKEKESNRWV